MARARASTPTASTAQSSATIGFEAKLWLTADKLRNNMDTTVTERSEQTVLFALEG